jgi:hypothetical protein
MAFFSSADYKVANPSQFYPAGLLYQLFIETPIYRGLYPYRLEVLEDV